MSGSTTPSECAAIAFMIAQQRQRRCVDPIEALKL